MQDVLPTSTPQLQTSSFSAAPLCDHDVITILSSFKSFCDVGFKRQALESTKQQQMLNRLWYCVDQHHVCLKRLQDDYLKLAHNKHLGEMRDGLLDEVGIIRMGLNAHFASRQLEERIQEKEIGGELRPQEFQTPLEHMSGEYDRKCEEAHDACLDQHYCIGRRFAI